MKCLRCIIFRNSKLICRKGLPLQCHLISSIWSIRFVFGEYSPLCFNLFVIQPPEIQNAVFYSQSMFESFQTTPPVNVAKRTHSPSPQGYYKQTTASPAYPPPQPQSMYSFFYRAFDISIYKWIIPTYEWRFHTYDCRIFFLKKLSICFGSLLLFFLILSKFLQSSLLVYSWFENLFHRIFTSANRFPSILESKS